MSLLPFAGAQSSLDICVWLEGQIIIPSSGKDATPLCRISLVSLVENSLLLAGVISGWHEAI